MSEEELVGVDHVSATAAEVSGSMMRIKLELEEKKRTVNMLQSALVGKTIMLNVFYSCLMTYLQLRLCCCSCFFLTPAGSAEGADSQTCEGDGEGAEQELSAPEGTV